MIKSRIDGIRIAGVAAAVSNKWTPITTFESEEDPKVIKKFIKKTGVEGRYDAGLKQTTSDFCCVAARELLTAKGIDPEDIGIVVFVTQTPDYGIPATACLIQDRLKISKDCIAFDVNLGCSGFSYGLNIVSSLMKVSNVDKALLLAGDTSAKEKSQLRRVKTTHSASMLFGDSGTATLLVKDSDAKSIEMVSKTDGSGFKAIIAPYGQWRNPDAPDHLKCTQMDDIEVFNFAVTEVPEILKETMEINQYTSNDYDCLVLHQANLFIIKQIAKRSRFDMDKTLISLDKFGNTSSSSIPISLVKEYGDKKDGRDIHALMCGFGVGLSWSTVDAYISENDILPIIHTDEYFEDGYSKVVEEYFK